MSTSNVQTEATDCPDGTRCLNGSLCTPNPSDEGAYYCDCDEASVNNVYAGLYCEHVATSYCTYNQEVSEVSFCTNEGTCTAEVGVDAAHIGCKCPDGYIGSHCQFTEGTTIPENHPLYGSESDASQSASSGGGGLSGGIVALIVIVLLAVVGGLAFALIYARKRKIGDPTLSKEVAPEFSLEADGNVLQEAVRSGSFIKENGSMEDVPISDSGENGGKVDDVTQII